MDLRNEESDYSSVENFLWDENLPLKTKSNVSLLGVFGCNVCSQGVQANFGNCRESRSFTSAFEQLGLCGKYDLRREEYPLQRTCHAQTEPYEDFRTTYHDDDILTYQGVRYPPEDIAPFWKKDSRMWLWKSLKRLRKKEKTEDPSATIIKKINEK